jgi:hypothetical protein
MYAFYMTSTLEPLNPRTLAPFLTDCQVRDYKAHYISIYGTRLPEDPKMFIGLGCRELNDEGRPLERIALSPYISLVGVDDFV